MKTVKLTQVFIRSLARQTRAYTIQDSLCHGLGVKVMPDKPMQYVISRLIDNRTRTRILAPVSALTVKAAREKATGQLQAWREEHIQPSMSASPRFDVFVEQTWKPMIFEHWKPSTKRSVLPALNRRLLAHFGRYPLHMINHKMVQAWFDEISKTRKGAANRNLDTLQSVFKLALRQGHCLTNPCIGIRQNKRRVLNRFLSVAEMQRLSVALDECEAVGGSIAQCADILRLLLLTGCRLSEITFLKGEYVRGNELHLPDSKTGAKVLYIGQAAVDILSRYHCKANTELFPMKQGASTSLVQSLWLRLRKQIGIEDVRLHDLRHTFASYAVMDGCSIPMVASLLGHKKVTMTLRYTHVGDDSVEQAAEVIGAVFKGIFTQSYPLKPYIPQTNEAPTPAVKVKQKRLPERKPTAKPKPKAVKKVKQVKPLQTQPSLTKEEIRAVQRFRDRELFL